MYNKGNNCQDEHGCYSYPAELTKKKLQEWFFSRE